MVSQLKRSRTPLSRSEKSSVVLKSWQSIPSASTFSTPSEELFEPLTLNPSALSAFASGKPSQPSPIMEMVCVMKILLEN